MTIHLPQQRVSLFTVPKCISTSLKHFAFAYENGMSSDAVVANGKPLPVHNLYRTAAFRQTSRATKRDFWKCAVVRDPISRVISTFRNRVVFGGVLERGNAKDALDGLNPTPDLDEFVANLGAYRRANEGVAHHTHKLHWYLGEDPAFFDRIYNIREVGALLDDLRARLGDIPELGHEMTEGPKLTAKDLGSRGHKHLKKMYEDDYRLYGRFFEVTETA